MTSLLTNASAITALQNLNATNKSMQTTQDRISTGMRVATASDNAAYWSIATTMKSDNSALSTVKDALGMGVATVDVTSSAVKSTVDLVSQIKSKLVAAKEPGPGGNLAASEAAPERGRCLRVFRRKLAFG